MKKHSVNILGHQTSVTLEDEFWQELRNEAKRSKISLNNLITQIDEKRGEHNLSSAIRLHILKLLQQKLNEANR